MTRTFVFGMRLHFLSRVSYDIEPFSRRLSFRNSTCYIVFEIDVRFSGDIRWLTRVGNEIRGWCEPT